MKKKKFKDRALIQKRLTLVVWTIVVVFFILILRLSYIMIVKRDEYSSRAEEQWTSEVSIDARRGRILDRNGVELAVSANVYRVDFDLNSVRQYLKNNSLTNADIAGKIADAVGMEENKVMEKLETKLASGANAGSATLIRRIEKESADKVNNLNIDGVIVSPDTKRYYPKGEFLAHVLGSTNVDGQGLTGVELQYNEYLSGVPGVRISEIERNEENLSYTISNFTEPIDGKDVTLTTDSKIQAIAEKVAEKGLVDNQAKRVSIMVMNPNNGEILAMVNKPDFDPNNAFDGFEDFSGETDGEKLQKMWRNSLVNDTFEPGSIFKVVTMVTALEEGIASESDTFECGGSLQVGSHTIKCWKTSGHGSQILPQILQNSCNVGFMELGERLGAEKLNEYIKKLGFGSITGIDLPGEAEGIVKSTNSISDIDLATIAFGQTNTLNALQLLTAVNAVANGGTLIQPHIVKEITHKDSNGNTIVDKTIEGKSTENVLSEKTCATLREYLERTATQDAGAGTFVQGYDIGGKTGTAQKVDPTTGAYSADKYIASMVAMTPVDDPQLTVYISVDEPSTGVYYGGQVASPLMKKLFSYIFSYIESPTGKASYSISKDVVIPEIRGKSVEEAKTILEENDLGCEVEGEGNTIVSINPYPGTTVKAGSKIKLTASAKSSIDNKIIMPDLAGTTVEFAINLLDNLGLQYEYEGSGKVVEQSISSGELISSGTKVKLVFKEESEY